MENNPNYKILLPMSSFPLNGKGEDCVVAHVIRSRALDCKERNPYERCDESGVLYFPLAYEAGSGCVALCARHWYGRHFGQSSDRQLTDLNDDEYKRALSKFTNHRREKLHAAIENIHRIASEIELLGVHQAAEDLFETTDALNHLSSELLASEPIVPELS